MTTTIGEIDPRYGDASATAPPWSQIERRLTDAQLYWIVTVRADGRPHAVPLVGGVARRGLRLLHRRRGAEAPQPRGEPARGRDDGHHRRRRVDSGTEVVVEGTAVRVTDHPALQELADAWAAKYGDDWRFEVRGEEFVELSRSGGATEGGARVFRVAPAKVLAFGGGHGQTRYRF
ncbi:pyridoxamine 5'-phosphate oxidase family protein [Petropleomorpha daqingensis]|uniref:Pyridoxamine 5'-phosphate oxidase n=1 Tax=Petropleomorpha daqingensis TaxID=2026353 RepID=A0A853CKL3_9ACTN|nr:pyridoxamine 5'-phosphate oxidase family protein [Petropleomorpha daqingensis]NYJ08107.1 hypothetical protein [Petropleomorpha daqingensis]